MKASEHLLVAQRIKGNRKVGQGVLARYYQQRPNTRFLGMPFGLWFYQIGRKQLDLANIQQRIAQIEGKFTKRIQAISHNPSLVKRLQKQRDSQVAKYRRLLKEGNWLMRWGEPPVRYEESQRQATELSLKHYLQSKGYFDATVSNKVTFKGKCALITYHIQESQPYHIRTLRATAADKAIEQLLKATQKQSVLRLGMRYDQEALRMERDRIYALLQEHGYFQFDKRYVHFNVDMTGPAHTAAIETVIALPSDQPSHPIFDVEDIHWTHEEGYQPKVEPLETFYAGISFTGTDKLCAPHILANQIPTIPPHRYQQSQDAEILRRLSKVNMFEKIYVTQEIRPSNKLVTHIHTCPLDRYQLSGELGFQSPYYLIKSAIQARNITNRLDTATLTVHADTEGVRSSSNHSWGMDFTWALPKFALPLSTRQHRELAGVDPITKLEVGFDLVTRTEYTQNTYKGLLSYLWHGWGKGQYEFVLVHVDILDTRRVSPDFKQHLQTLKQQGSNLYRAFDKPAWVTHSAIKATFAYPATSSALSQRSLTIAAESGGLSQFLFDVRNISNRFEYFQYVKFSFDYTQCLPLGRGAAFAYRANAGAAGTYGANKLLPYERYYFAGGARGIRAWHARSLGPGSCKKHNCDPQKRVEHPGELLLQGSLELRQQLKGILEGALFLDAGNVWTLHNQGKPAGQFKPDRFYQEIAIGTGIGLRFNVQFFVFRLDAGLKLYDPGYPRGQRLINNKLATHKHLRLRDQLVYHLDIGYPF